MLAINLIKHIGIENRAPFITKIAAVLMVYRDRKDCGNKITSVHTV